MKLNSIVIIASMLSPMLAVAAPSIKGQIPEQVYKVLLDNYPLEKLEEAGSIILENKIKIDSEYYILSLGESVVAISETGNYVLGGDVVNLTEKVNYMNEAKNNSRKRTVESISSDGYISYPSTYENKKGVIYVYSDITCSFCSKLHKEFPQINAAGYEVRVVPFVRNVGTEGYETSKVYKDTVAMMSEQDLNNRTLIHDQLVAGKSIKHTESNAKGVSAVAKGIETGVAVGLQGTPHIVFEDGRSISGYVQSEQLIKIATKH